MINWKELITTGAINFNGVKVLDKIAIDGYTSLPQDVWNGVAILITVVLFGLAIVVNIVGNVVEGSGAKQNATDTILKTKSEVSVMGWKTGLVIGVAVVGLALSSMLVGINDGGNRTVVQYPSSILAMGQAEGTDGIGDGVLDTKFAAGLYWKGLGSTETYRDVITYDFDKEVGNKTATLEQQGINVRYQDGGKGSIYGLARFSTPITNVDMIKLHKAYRSNEGVATKLIKNTVEATLNHTAGLMTSEESYAEKRGIYAQWSEDQLEHGKYLTKLVEKTTTEVGFEYCLQPKLTDEQETSCSNIKQVIKNVPVIATQVKDGVDTGMPAFTSSDLQANNVTKVGFEVVDWGYEQTTLDQISEKRKATMGIITSKARAEEAKQETITAREQGLANVEKARYEREVEKAKKVVEAQQIAEIAVIKATQNVDVATQKKLEAAQLKLAAKEYKQEQILRGEGDGAYKREVMESDGYMPQKIEAWKTATIAGYTELAKQKWAPEIMMGGGEGGNGSASSIEQMLSLIAVKNAKDLSLDMSMTAPK